MKLKGGKMNTRIILWIIIGVLFVAVLFLSFKAGAGGSIQTATASTKTAVSSASSYSGMVGGC